MPTIHVPDIRALKLHDGTLYEPIESATVRDLITINDSSTGQQFTVLTLIVKIRDDNGESVEQDVVTDDIAAAKVHNTWITVSD
jgi:hypothetical protein